MAKQGPRLSDDYVDGRARLGWSCALLSLVGFAYHPIGFFFGPLAVITSLASVLSVDEPPTRRTRELALAGTLVGAAVLATVLFIAVVSGDPG